MQFNIYLRNISPLSIENKPGNIRFKYFPGLHITIQRLIYDLTNPALFQEDHSVFAL